MYSHRVWSQSNWKVLFGSGIIDGIKVFKMKLSTSGCCGYRQIIYTGPQYLRKADTVVYAKLRNTEISKIDMAVF